MSATPQLADRPFPELVRTTRLRAGLTQQQLADLSALSVRAVRDLEAGRVRRPRRDTVRLLADALRLGPAGASALIGAATGEPGPTNRTAELHGRATELATLQELLVAADQPLVSIVGLPGSGKSRLAAEVARLCQLFGWQVAPDAAQLPAQPAPGLQPRLLVLDDADPDAPQLDALRSQRPGLRVLRCAGAPLGIVGEHVLPLAGLPVPVTGSVDEPAIALFLSHARRSRPGLAPAPAELALIAEVCQSLDGLPGALVHAADWSLVLSWSQLAAAAAQDPLGIAAPPAPSDGSAWRAAALTPLAALGPVPAGLLATLAGDPAERTLEQLSQHLGQPPVELARSLHPLTVRGLVGCRRTSAGPTFRVPNLVRAALAGSPEVPSCNR